MRNNKMGNKADIREAFRDDIQESFRAACLSGRTKLVCKIPKRYRPDLTDMAVLFVLGIKWRRSWMPNRLVLKWSVPTMIDECCRAYFGRVATMGEKIFPGRII